MVKNLSNIVLIGMPGSGKSTIGIMLAKKTKRKFIDTDALIEISEGRKLQNIVDNQGHMTLREIEERVIISDVNDSNAVIATGGSAAYSERAMKHLKSDGIIVFLNADLEALRARMDNFDNRGIAKRPEQSLEDLFNERFILYNRYADITIDCSKMIEEDVCDMIIKIIK